MKGKTKSLWGRFLYIFLSVSLSFSFMLSIAATAEASTTRLYIEPKLVGAKAINDTFSVDVKVADVTDLYSFQFDVIFDPTVLQVQSVVEGDFLKSGGVTTSFEPGNTSTPGLIDNVYGLRKYVTYGASGSGTLAIITFKVIGTGVSSIDLTRDRLANSNEQYIDHLTEDGLFDNQAPTVSSANPANNATNVPVTTNIAATFSQAMDSSTINPTTFTLYQGATQITGVVSYNIDAKTATFNPDSDLAYETSYTATITTGAKDLAGNPLASAYSWSFTTQGVPPVTTISTTPTFPDGNNDWFKTVPSITLTRNEPGTTYYSWVSATGPWTTYSTFFSAPEGENTLYYYSVDTAENAEAIKNQPFKVDSVAPTSSINSPSEGAHLSGTSYNITGTASDSPSSGVAKVEVSINGEAWQEATGMTPWSYSWTLPADGTYNIKSRATDNAGNVETPGAGVNVTVDNTIPTVSITNPANNSMIKGTVNVTADASDNIGVTKVEFYIDGALQFTDADSPYMFAWNTPAYLDGVHSLKAIAYDRAGNTGEHIISVTVDNTAPSVTSTDPVDEATAVPVTTTVKATFSEEMDSSTINTSTFTLYKGTTQVTGTVSYNSLTKTAIFTPSTNLDTDSTYTATITTGVKDLVGNPLTSDKLWSFTTVDTIAPTTSLTTSPSTPDGAGGWFKTTPTITLTANEPATTYYQWDSTTGSWETYSGSFTALEGSHILYYYSKDVAGNSEDVKSQVFKVDTGKPSSTITAPTEDKRIAGTSYTIAGTSSDTGESNVALVEVSTDGGATWNLASGTTAWTYTWTLPADGSYNLKSRAKDMAGNVEIPGAGVNVTVDNTAPGVVSTSPADGQTGVAVGTNVTATFSEDTDASTINTSTFTLSQGATQVTATVTYDSATKTATLDPSTDLASETVYTATVTTGAKDLAGNSLVANKVWIFTTADVIAPTTSLTTSPSTPDGESGWFKTVPSITLTRNESGTTYYQWDSTTGVWITYSAPFNALEGEHTLYYYSVDTAGNAEVTKNKVFKVDTQAPSVPTKVKAIPMSSSQIDLSWAASTDTASRVAEYEIYKVDSEDEIPITTQTSYSDIDLESDTTYGYYLKAYDMAGNISDASSTVSATTYKEAVPTPEGTDVLVDLGNNVSLVFEEITNSGSTSVTVSQTGPDAPSGFSFQGYFYDITTTDVTYSGKIIVTFPYDPADIVGAEEDLRLFHWENEAWKDVTVLVDTEKKLISGEVTSLSPFAIGSPIPVALPPTPTPPPAGPPADTTPPSCTIISPGAGWSLTNTIGVIVYAVDNVGIDRVDFYIDGNYVSTDRTDPYTYDWDTTTVSDGLHTISAAVYDTSGNVSSDAMFVSVANAAAKVLAVAEKPAEVAPMVIQKVYYQVHVGAFRILRDARRIVRRLKRKGFSGKIIIQGGGRPYLVQVGIFEDLASARKLYRRLRAKKFRYIRISEITSTTGAIFGKVVNDIHQPISGAAIRIDETVIPTNHMGEFRFSLVHSGIYIIYYDAAGYKGQTQMVEVKAGVETRPPMVIMSR